MAKNPIVAALFVLGGLVSPLMAADPPKLTLTVTGKIVSGEKVREKKDRKDEPKKDEIKKEVINKTLEVRISSTAAVDPGPLTVKCNILGRDLGTKDKVLHKEVTAETKLEGREVTVKLPPVEFVTTEAGTKKGADGKQEKVEASGNDYRGFEILVSNAAGEVIGKGYSSPAIAEDIEREAKAKK